MSHAQVETSRLIDWVSFSVDTGSLSRLFECVPGLSELMVGAREGNGRHNYRTAYYGDGVAIFMDGRIEGMGSLVQLSGRGCEVLVAPDVEGFFKRLLGFCMNVTRVDVTHDVLGRSFEDVQEQLEAGNYTSRLRNYQYRAKGTRPGCVDKGRTMELGSRQSETFLRIYEACKMHAAAPVGTLRFELELKGDRAGAVSRLLAAGETEAAFGVIRSVIEFREVAADSNRARWAVSEWWFKAIGEAKTILRTVSERVAVTVERLVSWVDRQLAPALCALREAIGSEVFDMKLSEGRHRAVLRYGSLMASSS